METNLHKLIMKIKELAYKGFLNTQDLVTKKIHDQKKYDQFLILGEHLREAHRIIDENEL